MAAGWIDVIAGLGFAFSIVLMIGAITQIAYPLVTTGAIPQNVGLSAIWFFIGGIVTSILVVLFLKPGTASQALARDNTTKQV